MFDFYVHGMLFERFCTCLLIGVMIVILDRDGFCFVGSRLVKSVGLVCFVVNVGSHASVAGLYSRVIYVWVMLECLGVFY